MPAQMTEAPSFPEIEGMTYTDASETPMYRARIDRASRALGIPKDGESIPLALLSLFGIPCEDTSKGEVELPSLLFDVDELLDLVDAAMSAGIGTWGPEFAQRAVSRSKERDCTCGSCERGIHGLTEDVPVGGYL